MAQALIEQGAWEEVIEVCRAILIRDDCWEPAYRLMMVAYTQLDNRVQALRAYQRCVDRLCEELGVEPTPATVDLCTTIL